VTLRSTRSPSRVGLGRRQVLSELGRGDAAQRWHDGDFGPGSAMARSTRRVCRDCGFYIPLAGALGALFVCAPTRWPPTGMSLSPNMDAGHTLTHRRRPAAARRSMTRSTTVCLTSPNLRISFSRLSLSNSYGPLVANLAAPLWTLDGWLRRTTSSQLNIEASLGPCLCWRVIRSGPLGPTSVLREQRSWVPARPSFPQRP